MTYEYTSRDYAALRSEIEGIMRRRIPGWVGDPSDFGTVLVEAVAYMGDLMSYYIDRAMLESSILTASTPNAVRSLAELNGYSPGLARSESLTVDISSTAATTIPQYSAFITPDGTRFENVGSEIGVSPSAPVRAVLREGTTQSPFQPLLVGRSDGSPSQSFDVLLTLIGDADSLGMEIQVQEPSGTSSWTYVRDIHLSGPSDRVFSATFSDRTLHVLFGDGVSGVIPPANTEMHLKYRVCSGNVHVVSGTALDVYAPAGSSTFLSGVSAVVVGDSSGGTASETVEEIRTNTVRKMRSQGRAVTREDYVDQAIAIPGVLSAQVDFQMWSRPIVYVLPSGSPDNSGESLLQSISDSLTKVCLAGVSPTVIWGAANRVTFDVLVQLSPMSSRSQAKNAVERVLQEEFPYSRSSMGTSISVSAATTAISRSLPTLACAVLGVRRSDEDPSLTAQSVDPEVGELLYYGSCSISFVGGIEDGAEDA